MAACPEEIMAPNTAIKRKRCMWVAPYFGDGNLKEECGFDVRLPFFAVLKVCSTGWEWIGTTSCNLDNVLAGRPILTEFFDGLAFVVFGAHRAAR